MIAIIDYDAGNLKSVEKALSCLGEESVITRKSSEILAAEKVILPGVGAFGRAMEQLKQYDLVPVIHEAVEQGKPFLGICLGLQLLFEGSQESSGVEGLGVLKGEIVKIPKKEGLKIPHVGWNSLFLQNHGRLFEGISQGAFVYFVHSYYLKAKDEDSVKAVADYGVRIHASVEAGNVFACQFHPEKSSGVGLQILQNFAKAGRYN
ncbi:imidazole glycerol phosphate synthase subunit HisH [Lachnospiraceae bacterium]|nr:imidazole glycerol phosphate synthase subunit HisH [Lachnospiraceae bacterium]